MDRSGKALLDDRRAQLVEELRTEPAGLDVQELARRLGLHPNTVRWHLGVLADAGLVGSQRAARSTPGRPRVLYLLRPEALPEQRGEHRLLASILTGAVAGLSDGPALAGEAGRAWGRYLIESPAPVDELDAERALHDVAALLEQQGFEPELDGLEIRMRRCPFHDLAGSHPEIVCTVHEGLLSGALEELGAPLEVDRLDAFVRPDLCVARFAKRS